MLLNNMTSALFLWIVVSRLSSATGSERLEQAKFDGLLSRRLQEAQRNVRFIQPNFDLNEKQNLTCEVFRYARVAPGMIMDCPDEPLNGENRGSCFSYLEPGINITTSGQSGIKLYSERSVLNISSHGVGASNSTESIIFHFPTDMAISQVYINVSASHYPVEIKVNDQDGEVGVKNVFNNDAIGVISSTPVTSISLDSTDGDGGIEVVEQLCFGKVSPLKSSGFDEATFSKIVQESALDLICEDFETSSTNFGASITCNGEPVNSGNLGGCFQSLKDGFSLRSSGGNGIGSYGSAVVPNLASAGVGAWNPGDATTVSFDDLDVIAASFRVYSDSARVTVTVVDANDDVITTVDVSAPGYFWVWSDAAIKGIILSSKNDLHVLDNLCFARNTPPIANCIDVQGAAFDNTCDGFISIDNGSLDRDEHPLEIMQVPDGPYKLGETRVILIVKDGMDQKTCNGRVTIIDETPPAIFCGMDLVERIPGSKKEGIFLLNFTVVDNCEIEGDPVISATLDVCDGGGAINVEAGQNVTVLFENEASCEPTLQVTAIDVFGNEDTCTFLPSLKSSASLSRFSLATIWVGLVLPLIWYIQTS